MLTGPDRTGPRPPPPPPPPHHNGDNQNIHERIFSIDYSKRGTAKCRKCNKAITKGEIRIGKSMKFKVWVHLSLLHLDCIFKSFQRAKSTVTIIKDINDINGIESITPQEKLQVKKLIENLNAALKKSSFTYASTEGKYSKRHAMSIRISQNQFETFK